jgi:peptidoglycan-associated lipoprotein
MMMKRFPSFALLAVVVALSFAACGGKKPPVAAAPPPNLPAPFPGASASGTTSTRPPDPPPIPDSTSVRSAPLDSWDSKSVEEINGPNSPLKPVFFLYDSDELDDAGKKALAADAEILQAHRTWVVTVEGHCDERGTAEYNLALGDRRALAARNYLLTLGIGAERLRTVSYGKEFPFDAGHDESAWLKNRRAHFMLTSK